jgi:hypothetical protein
MDNNVSLDIMYLWMKDPWMVDLWIIDPWIVVDDLQKSMVTNCGCPVLCEN